MSKKTSPNDSLQQSSTREPSQRSADTISFPSTQRFLSSSGMQIGGGSHKLYMMDHLARMHVDIEAATRKLELEKRRLAKLDQDLVLVEQEHESKRQRYKVNQPSQEPESRQVEKRLVKAIADLNKGMSENEQLRHEIDRLRRERELLNTVFKQLERGIASNRRGMDRLKANMNGEKMEDEDAKQKSRALGKLLERERVDFQRYTEKLRSEVEDLAEAEKGLGRHRDPGPPRDSPATLKGKSRRAYKIADEEEAFSEQAMHRRILKLSFLNTIQRRHIKQHQKNIEVFEQAFATIRSSTGISDIEEIVQIFIVLEQRNFSLLTYVNQLNQDIEYVSKRNRELDAQMGKLKNEEGAALNDISVQIAKTKAATQEKKQMIEEAEGALEECSPLIHNIVKYLAREVPALARDAFEGDAPPMKTSPTDSNEGSLNQHLMYIEEAMSLFKVCLNQEPPPASLVPKGVGSLKNPGDLPSAHVADNDSDDDPETGWGDRPWNKAELRERAQANIQRRRKKRGEASARPAHEERGRLETSDEAASAGVPGEATRRDVGPPPPKDNTASSVTSKDSGDNSSPAAGGGPGMPRSPGTSSKPQGVDVPGGSPREGAAAQEDDSSSPTKAWWSSQNAREKRR